MSTTVTVVTSCPASCRLWYQTQSESSVSISSVVTSEKCLVQNIQFWSPTRLEMSCCLITRSGFSATQMDRNVRRQLVLWPRFCLEMLCCVPASHQMCLLSEATKTTKTLTMSRPKYSVLGTKTSKIYIFYQPNTAGNVPTSDPKRCRSPLWLQLSRASCVSSTLQGSETSVRRLW